MPVAGPPGVTPLAPPFAMLRAMRMAFDAIHGSQKFLDSQTTNAMKRATARYVWVKGDDATKVATSYTAKDFAMMLFGIYDKKGQVYAFEQALKVAQAENTAGELDGLISELSSNVKQAEAELARVGKDKKLEPVDKPKGDTAKKNTKLVEKISAIKAPGMTSYSGSDMVAALELPGKAPLIFAELASIQYSVFRENQLVRALGRVTPKGVTRGARTISGVLSFIEFDSSIVYKALEEFYDLGYRPLMDEMPLFDITLSMANEAGQRSTFKLYGLSCYSEGGLKTIDALVSRVSYEFYALDLDPTAPSKFKKGA